MKPLYKISFILLVANLAHGKILNFQKLIDEVNSRDSSWVAGHNFDPNVRYDTLQWMARGAVDRNMSRGEGVEVVSHADMDIEIPKTFDARKHWKNCKSIQTISDQGACKSSWAQNVADAFTDRLCVATKGKVKLPRSTEQLMTCCEDCLIYTNPCSGGALTDAWEYVVSNGLVTGGSYNSKSGCQPYTVAPCTHTNPFAVNQPNCNNVTEPTPPACSKSCTNKSYKKKFNSDIRYAEKYYYMSTVQDIQKDIMTYGSATSGIFLYEDFYTYKKGVYKYVTGDWLGTHMVRVIGWGEENGVPYWLGVNNWNKNWGDKGTFKIKRGDNECQIEYFMSGATVKKSS